MSDNREEIRRIVRAQSGESQALDDLLKGIQEPVYRYVRRIVHDEHIARDVVQEVFLSIVKNLYWLREPGVFRPWVFRIASRQAFRCLRRERRQPKIDSDFIMQSVREEQADERPDRERLGQALELIVETSPASRAVLSLHYIDGMTLQEVADILEISLSAVKSRLAYGLKVLRKQIDARAE